MARPPKAGNLSSKEVAEVLLRELSTRGAALPSIRDIQSRLEVQSLGTASISCIHEALQELSAKGVLSKDGGRYYIHVQPTDIQTVPSFGYGCNLVLDHARESKLTSYSLKLRETWLPAKKLHRNEALQGGGPAFEGDTEHGPNGFFQRLYETLIDRSHDGRETRLEIALQAPSEMTGLMKRLAQVENIGLEWEHMEQDSFKKRFSVSMDEAWLLTRALASATMVTHMARCYRNFRAINDSIQNNELTRSRVSLQVKFYTGWSSFPLMLGEGIACKGEYATYASSWDIPALLIQGSSEMFSLCERDMMKTFETALPSSIESKLEGESTGQYDEKARAFCEGILNEEEEWRLIPYFHSIEKEGHVRPGTLDATTATIGKAREKFEL